MREGRGLERWQTGTEFEGGQPARAELAHPRGALVSW
jgi:hypothetical protein